MPAQEKNDEHQECVAAEMDGESDKVPRCVPGEEDLRTCEELLVGKGRRWSGEK